LLAFSVQNDQFGEMKPQPTAGARTIKRSPCRHVLGAQYNPRCMKMDAETLNDIEHLLDDQLPNIRRTNEEAIKAGCADPVVWLFNLELKDSREVAIDIFGKRLCEKLKAQQRGDAIPSCCR
jgi:hypothetical protein